MTIKVKLLLFFLFLWFNFFFKVYGIGNIFRIELIILTGKTALRTIPAIDATASGESVIAALPIVKLTVSLERPSAQTRITAATIRLRLFVKSTLFSTTFLTPIAEIIP